MTTGAKQYCTEGVVAEIRNEGKGYGLFAARTIAPGEVICVWGGDILNHEQLLQCSAGHQMHSVQIDEGLYIVPHGEPELPDYVNHSCEPNVGIKGQIAVVAMRTIEPGEEICFDYAMTDGSSYDEFECACGTPSCRGTISGRDWMRPELQARYKGWFSYYLERRILNLQAESET